MRPSSLPVAALVALVTTVTAGCGGEEPDPFPDPSQTASSPVSSPVSSSPAAPAAPAGDDSAARSVVDQYYTAFGGSDCITMRRLSTIDEQREDDAWADCIAVVAEVAGEDYAFEVVGGGVDGDAASYDVRVTATVDDTERSQTDEIRLVGSDGAWLVDDSLVTAG